MPSMHQRLWSATLWGFARSRCLDGCRPPILSARPGFVYLKEKAPGGWPQFEVHALKRSERLASVQPIFCVPSLASLPRFQRGFLPNGCSAFRCPQFHTGSPRFGQFNGDPLSSRTRAKLPLAHLPSGSSSLARLTSLALVFEFLPATNARFTLHSRSICCNKELTVTQG
jgi:hypothetical protein